MSTLVTLKVTADVSQISAAREQISYAEAWAANKAMDIVWTGAQALAAVDTGFMWSQIKGTQKARAFKVVARAPYSGFVEFGTRKMKAQPYMTPSFETTPYEDIARQSLKQAGL